MDKGQKMLYQREVEKFLEGNKVYEVFEDLIKNLLINQPNNPIDYMINKLDEPEQKIIFVVGPPGSKVRELSLQLADHLKFTCSSVGDLLTKEVGKKTELGKTIEESYNQLKYVPDHIVIDMVKKHLGVLAQQKTSLVLEGFPKTRAQGLSLQKDGIIPDTFLIFNLPDDQIVSCAQKKIKNNDGRWVDIENPDKVATDYASEYSLNIKHVKDLYRHYFFSIDAANNEEFLLEEMDRLVKYRIKNKSPKRSARILVMGPPGSGRSSIARGLSKRFGFVNINTAHLLADQASKRTEIGRMCIPIIAEGELVPDDIICSLVTQRLKQPDCNIHGYILDGFPKTGPQISLLYDLKIRPTVIVVLECPDEIAIERLSHKKIDPVSGQIYDLNELKQDLPQEILDRLQSRPQDEREIVEKRIARWKELLKEVEQEFSPNVLKVSSELSEQNVLEKISFHLENLS